MMNGQLDGNQPITITLPLATWQQVIQTLVAANPLIVAIDRGIQDALQAQRAPAISKEGDAHDQSPN